jgi:hypothetical protein
MAHTSPATPFWNYEGERFMAPRETSYEEKVIRLLEQIRSLLEAISRQLPDRG